MFFAGDVGAVAHGIQLAVAPVFLLTAVATMIGTVAGRLARIIDRTRQLEDRLRASSPEQSLPLARAELKQLRSAAT